MSWALGTDIAGERLLEYEAQLNHLSPASGMRLLCQYNRSRFPSEIVRGVLRTHPWAILGERVHDNPFFEPSAPVLGGTNIDERRVDWMIDQIRKRTQRAAALADLGSWALEPVAPILLMPAAAHLIWQEIRALFVEILTFATHGETVARSALAGFHDASLRAVQLAAADVWLEEGGAPRREPVVIPDWSQPTLFPYRAELAAHGVNSSAAAPIYTRHGQPPDGVIWIHSAEPRIFTEDEMLFVNTIAMTLGEAIARVRAENDFGMVVEHSADIIARFDLNLRHAYINPAIERVTGVSASTLIGKTSRQAGLPETLASAWELVLNLTLRTGHEQSIEFALQTPLGIRHLQTRIMPEVGPDGAVQSLLSISRDVTEQREAEAQRANLYPVLVSQQARLTELFSRLDDDRVREKQLAADLAQAAQLTTRQRQTLALMAKGRTNREIAAELNISPGTVTNRIRVILEVLGAESRTEAAVRFVTMGIPFAE
jgi:PAS domain S-box-containing protein